MRLTRPRAVSAVLLAVAVAAGVAACGSGSAAGGGAGGEGAESVRKDPLAGLHTGQIVSRAVTNTRTAASVRVRVTGTDSGRKLTADVTVVRGRGCQGTFAESGQGSAKIIYDRDAVWLNGDRQFWVSNGGNDPAVLSLFLGKYIKSTDEKSFAGPFTQFCDLKSLLAGFPADVPDLPLTHTTVDGQPAVELKDTADAAALYLSDSARPVVLRATDPGSGSDIRFTGYGATRALTYPPARQVLDGGKYGI